MHLDHARLRPSLAGPDERPGTRYAIRVRDRSVFAMLSM
jgi:hypothetical protein